MNIINTGLIHGFMQYYFDQTKGNFAQNLSDDRQLFQSALMTFTILYMQRLRACNSACIIMKGQKHSGLNPN